MKLQARQRGNQVRRGAKKVKGPVQVVADVAEAGYVSIKVVPTERTKAKFDAAAIEPVPKPPVVVAVVGGPGVGRSSVCGRAASELGWEHLQLDALVAEAAGSESALGDEVKEFVAEGKVLPLRVHLAILAKTVASGPSGRKYVLDGWPRSAEQLEGLEEAVGPLAAVVHLAADRAAVEARLGGRDGDTWDYFDDADRAADDEAVLARVTTHESQAAPLLAAIAARGSLKTVEAGGELSTTYVGLHQELLFAQAESAEWKPTRAT